MGNALAWVLFHSADDGLGDFADFLGELHDTERFLGVGRQLAACVDPVDDFPDSAPGIIHETAG